MTPSVVAAFNLRAGIGHIKLVRFVFAQLLHRLGPAGSLNHQRGARRIRDLHVDGRHPGLPAKLPEENLDRAIQPRLVMPGDRDREVAIDQKLAIARLHLCRQGHEIQGLRRLRLNHGCKGHAQHYSQNNPHDSLSRDFAV